MLKITAIGNLTNDVTLKTNETTGKPYAILRIASDRRYKDTRRVYSSVCPCGSCCSHCWRSPWQWAYISACALCWGMGRSAGPACLQPFPLPWAAFFSITA